MSKRAANAYSKSKQPVVKGGFAMIRFDVIDSPAFANLSSSAIHVLIYLKREFNGHNNGAIVMSCRMVSDKTGMSRTTAHRALTELQTHGFIRISRPGWYAGHIATTWELTDSRNNMTLDKEKNLWRQWKTGVDCRALDPDYRGLVSPDTKQNKVPYMQHGGNEIKPQIACLVPQSDTGVL